MSSNATQSTATELPENAAASTNAETKVDWTSSDLIDDLFKVGRKDPKLVKNSEYEVEVTGEDGKTVKRYVYSWKMNEYKYNVYPSPFPTLARGLFTEEVSTPPGAGKKGRKTYNRIVARGYDKFFNMNEVPWNTWDAITKHTESPYHLTVKANGCIIFMSALSPTDVVVTSKHSLGPVGNWTSHAQMGERWLERHLDSKGKRKSEFAKRLWEENITAVAELCDDSFEEHVLPYTKEETGLHLHGINKNQGAFQTADPADVDAFAEEWGFIKTGVITLQDPQEVREFTDEVGETGKWNGRQIEGFVVRTKIKTAGGKPGRDSPPYPPGSDYFFKIKFDEPYMTYRDWREMTRFILAAKKKDNIAHIPKSKLRRPESYVYRDWVTREIDRTPGLFTEFNNGKGVIAVREAFQEWLETREGQDALVRQTIGKGGSLLGEGSSNTSRDSTTKWERVVIVPVAIPGCGKTVIGLSLAKLFGIGHTQSDDIKAKKSAATFQNNISEVFKKRNIVFADRNNHLTQHRTGIRETVRRLKGPSIKIVALNWGTHQLPLATMHRICADRVYGRGENHQSLRPNDSGGHEDVIWKFLKDSDELAEDEVDKILEMNVEDTPEQAVRRVIDFLGPLVGWETPSNENIKEACEEALSYSPKVKKDIKAETKNARYYGLLPEVNLQDVIEEALTSAEDQEIPTHIKSLWESLKADKRVQNRPHITVVHMKSLPDGRALWDQCKAIIALPKPPLFSLRLSNILCDGDVMALVVDELDADQEEGKTFAAQLPEDVKGVLHITVGTRTDEFSPVLAKDMTEKWRNGEAGETIHVLPLHAVKAQGLLKGLF